MSEKARLEQAEASNHQKGQVRQENIINTAGADNTSPLNTRATGTTNGQQDTDMTDVDTRPKAGAEDEASSLPVLDNDKNGKVSTGKAEINKQTASGVLLVQNRKSDEGKDAKDLIVDLPSEHDQLDHELFDKTPTTAGIKDSDIDNLFGDGELISNTMRNGDNENDTSRDQKLDQNNGNHAENPSSTIASKDSANHTSELTNSSITAPTATDATVSSFLPGLESYANNFGLGDNSNNNASDMAIDLDFLNAPLTLDGQNGATNLDSDTNGNNSDTVKPAIQPDNLADLDITVPETSNVDLTQNLSVPAGVEGLEGLAETGDGTNSFDDLFGYGDFDIGNVAGVDDVGSANDAGVGLDIGNDGESGANDAEGTKVNTNGLSTDFDDTFFDLT